MCHPLPPHHKPHDYIGKFQVVEGEGGASQSDIQPGQYQNSLKVSNGPHTGHFPLGPTWRVCTEVAVYGLGANRTFNQFGHLRIMLGEQP